MTAGQVAEVFEVPRQTVSRWARLGKLKAFKTPGGRYRFRRTEIEPLFPREDR